MLAARHDDNDDELKLKFDHMNKWNIHKPESFLKKGTHKKFYNFQIQKGLPDFSQETRPS